MAKKVQDLKKGLAQTTVNLRANSKKKSKKRLKKSSYSFYKKEEGIEKIKDLYSTDKKEYLYVKGEKFKTPKNLGNLLKIGFIGILIVMLINLINVYYKGKSLETKIQDTAYEGYSHLIDAGKNASKIQFNNALESFETALKSFSTAQNNLWFISTDMTFYAEDGSMIQAVNAILKGGQHFSLAGSYFTEALEEFNKIPVFFISKNENPNRELPPITEILKKGLEKTNLAIEEINLASENLKKVNEDNLPPQIKSKISFAKEKTAEITETLNSISETFPSLLSLLGDESPHRYLIILQNNNEIRPTGGFIGSYAVVEIDQGYIGEMNVIDVYDLDGAYKGYIEPPEYIKDFAKNWRFRDANYSYDFPTSAAKLKWILEKEGGGKIDTVIGINQGLVKSLLEITGPIQVGDFGKLNSENYNLLLSFIIESKIWGAEDPKHILKVFIPQIKKAILKEEHLPKLASKIFKGIQQKHIMLWSGDAQIQELFESSGLSGQAYLNEDDEDYLSVINFAVGGTKSDQFLEEEITHKTHIYKYGSMVDEVTIKRTHQWTDDIYYQWKKIVEAYGFDYMDDHLIDILGRGRNESIIKIYVPEGSVLLEKMGADFETFYDPDVKKTYFIANIEVKAGESKEVRVKYRLPFILDLNNGGAYKLIVEKQPGSRGTLFNKEFEADEDLENMGLYPEELNTNLVYDRYFSSIWGR
jgi:hypothetical protein